MEDRVVPDKRLKGVVEWGGGIDIAAREKRQRRRGAGLPELHGRHLGGKTKEGSRVSLQKPLRVVKVGWVSFAFTPPLVSKEGG